MQMPGLLEFANPEGLGLEQGVLYLRLGEIL